MKRTDLHGDSGTSSACSLSSRHATHPSVFVPFVPIRIIKLLRLESRDRRGTRAPAVPIRYPNLRYSPLVCASWRSHGFRALRSASKLLSVTMSRFAVLAMESEGGLPMETVIEADELPATLARITTIARIGEHSRDHRSA